MTFLVLELGLLQVFASNNCQNFFAIVSTRCVILVPKQDTIRADSLFELLEIKLMRSLDEFHYKKSGFALMDWKLFTLAFFSSVNGKTGSSNARKRCAFRLNSLIHACPIFFSMSSFYDVVEY